jgi:Subtilase family/HYR domain
MKLRSTLASLLAFTIVTFATPLHLGARAQQQGPTEISPQALAQIEALIAEKESRSPTQRKVDSQLIYEAKQRAGTPLAAGVRTLENDVPYAPDGHPIVDVRATVSPELLDRLRALGGEILSSTAETVRMHIGLEVVETVAALPDVQFIGPRQDAMTTRAPAPPMTADAWARGAPERRQERRNALAAFLNGAIGAMQVANAGTGQGSQSSEGDVAHRANVARISFGVNGTGIKVGVLSNGVVNLAASQALGDLGPVTVLPGQTGTGDEGTAMLEIVHDLAPGAQLFFATAFTSITSFAQNIRDLRAAGCDIIVDDVFYFVETPFQDGAPGPTPTNGGAVIQAVKDVTASGALYFSSAGNSGNLNDGTAGVWQGDFVDGGATASPLPAGNRLHNFGSSTLNFITAVNTSAPISLYWSDPLGASSNDYDLFRLNSTATAVAASSTNIQSGTQDPYEQVGQNIAAPAPIVIVKKASAAPRFLHVNMNRGRLTFTTSGQTHGHSTVDSIGAYGVAATPAVGPFPNAFSTANTVETFSSDGPRRVFYQANGTPFTPGDVLSTGGTLLNKPDITAADGVAVTGVGGFPNPFFGTSAAAPHAAAIAALLKSALPGLTPAQIRTAITSTAIDIETPGLDRDSGAGIIMPVAALSSAGAVGTAFLELGIVAATENPGDGNGAVNAGEGASLAIGLKNVGGGAATNVAATLATSTPAVTLTQPGSSGYPNLPAVSGSGNNTGPLLFTLASDAACPSSGAFTLNVTYDGGSASLPFSLPFGTRTINISSTLDGIAPPSTSLFTGVTGTQTGRINRLNPPSTCGTTKAFPGLQSATGIRPFDAYTFNSCATSAPSCVTVTMANNSIAANPNAQLFDVAYIPSFNPASLALGYTADPAVSNLTGAPLSFSFTLPGGGTPFALAVHEVNPGTAANANYSLSVSGACFGNCSAPNQVPIAKAKNVTVFASALTCIASASIDDGSSDPDGDPLTITQSPAGPYALGTTPVLLTVVDPRGATSQATGSVTVVDNTPPSIVCPAPITVPAAPGTCSATVAFTPTASDTCSPPASIVSTPASGSIFPIGTTMVTSKATDAALNFATCTFPVTVVDQQAPVVTNLSATPSMLWPANHTMVDVTVGFDISDNCSGVCTLTVSSNESTNGAGDGNTSPDWNVIDLHHVQLRAERSGGGNGRIYTLKLTCTDPAGNATVKTTTVVVPHNQ